MGVVFLPCHPCRPAEIPRGICYLARQSHACSSGSVATNELPPCVLYRGLHPGELKLRDSKKTGPFVQGLVWLECAEATDIDDLMEEGLLNRTTGATAMNSQSSRSHSIFTIYLSMKRQLVDGNTVREHDRHAKVSASTPPRQGQCQHDARTPHPHPSSSLPPLPSSPSLFTVTTTLATNLHLRPPSSLPPLPSSPSLFTVTTTLATYPHLRP